MPPRILFVEDHADTRDMIAAVLGSGGYEVVTADDLKDGLRLARAGEFDLILPAEGDRPRPALDGPALLQWCR